MIETQRFHIDSWVFLVFGCCLVIVKVGFGVQSQAIAAVEQTNTPFCLSKSKYPRT